MKLAFEIEARLHRRWRDAVLISRNALASGCFPETMG